MSREELELEILTVKELAAYLQIDRALIYRLLKVRELPGFQVGSEWRFHVEAIDHWRMHAQETLSYGHRRNRR